MLPNGRVNKILTTELNTQLIKAWSQWLFYYALLIGFSMFVEFYRESPGGFTDRKQVPILGR